ncbi:MAG TPA: ferritin-like domain-containing protein [Mucilaginibacter sp.]
MKTESHESTAAANMARRSFLRYAGAGVATAGLLGLASCSKDHKIVVGNKGIDIGATGDLAILNYAYALEQLEAAFYTQVILTPYTGISADEKALLTAIRDHEIVHREFFKAALGVNAIPSLTVDFSAIDFTSRAKTLAAAKAFEDTGVKAYDGAGYLFGAGAYLTLAGKIVSVEARHAALISNLLVPGSFAADDQVDASGLNKSASIAEVLAIANSYLKTKVSASNYNYVAA